MISGQEIWNDVRETLKKKLAPTTFNQSFENVTKIDREENGVIFILVDSEFIKHNINRTHMENINNIIEKKNYGRKVKLKFITENDKQAQAIKPQEAFTPLRSNNLNLNYPFESFVTGESNRNAFLSASKVADTPGVYVNPLYIFGGVGLGKTHLMQAIGNYISDMNVENKIVYVQANDFVKDFQQASMDKNMKAFDDKYDNADILLIDDIQMLSGKNGSQNQFFNLFQSMMDRSKQVVITSDVPPNKLNGFMDRLTSRFQMGYQVNINQPDFLEVRSHNSKLNHKV